MAVEGRFDSIVGDLSDQLKLNLGDAREEGHAVTVGDSFPLKVRWRSEPQGLDLELEATPGPGLPYPRSSFHLRTGHPAEMAVERPGWTLHWSMLRGVPIRGDRNDIFADALQFAYGAMFHRVFPKGVTRDRDRALAKDTMRGLYAHLRTLAVHLAESCQPEARRVAMRFSPHVRFRFYSRLLDDRTGRLEQAASACPGALIFSFGLLEQTEPGLRGAGERLIGDVVAGRRLNQALDDAIEVWAEIAPQTGKRATGAGEPRARSAWLGLEQASPAERAHIKAAQRLLIRRAGSRVGATALFLPPPVAFAPEDIPRPVVANARWYRIMKASRATLWRNPSRPGLSVALSMFASKHADPLARLKSGWREVGPAMAELADFLAATERTPSRATDPLGLVDQSDRWHAQFWLAQDMGERAGALVPDPGGRDPLKIPLPPPLVPGWEGDGVVVRPLRTTRDLLEEGMRMRHCVASYLPRVLTGEVSIYSATIGGRPLTVEIHRDDGGRPAVGQVSGRANRDPTATEWGALRPWLSSLDAGQGREGPL